MILTVDAIIEDRRIDCGQVDTNLVGPAGLGVQFHKGAPVGRRYHFVRGAGIAALAGDRHAHSVAGMAANRCVDDGARSARMSEHFDVEWGDPALYDLTLNTERIPVAGCVDMVVALSRSQAFVETPASRQHLLDLALAARVRGALRAEGDTAHVDISVEVLAGAVTLSGIVSTPGEHDRCLDVAGAVTGVSTVKNQLRTMSGGIGARIFPSGSTR